MEGGVETDHLKITGMFWFSIKVKRKLLETSKVSVNHHRMRLYGVGKEVPRYTSLDL